MKTVTIRQVRSALARLDEIVAQEGELVVTCHGRPLARILPVRPHRGIPSRAEFRASMSPLKVSSETLIRRDREAR